MRFKVVVSYDGSEFNGSQKQPHYRSVEKELESALQKMHKHDVKVVMCSRTDKGVHSLGQTFHFDSDIKIDAKGVQKGMNALLPDDIYITSVEETSDDFHARYHAKSKTYMYKINIGEYNPLEHKYVYQLNKSLDLVKMKEASKLFIGEHDFYNFCGYQEEKIKDYVRTIEKIEIDIKDTLVTITIKGNGFIRYMVRMIVAILIEIGLNHKTEDFITSRLDSKEKCRSNYKVSGCGLYLVKIDY